MVKSLSASPCDKHEVALTDVLGLARSAPMLQARHRVESYWAVYELSAPMSVSLIGAALIRCSRHCEARRPM